MPDAVVESDAVASSSAPVSGKPRLGEELPIFCEKCGYSFQGLPQNRCEHCSILQFHCPECGHHQPINTLRPAAQKILGRARAVFLTFSIIGRLVFFAIYLFGWFIAGVNYSSQFFYNPRQRLDMEELIPLAFFGFVFGVIGRLSLLRRRNGLIVGLALAAIEAIVIMIGVYSKFGYRSDDFDQFHAAIVVALPPMIATLLGAIIAWPIWVALVHVFLPQRAATIVLDWQRSLSSRTEALAREA